MGGPDGGADAPEPKVEPIFRQDSYGYRRGKSALDAVWACWMRCWRKDWVIDMDIRAFFDSVPHDPVFRAVAHHISRISGGSSCMYGGG
ncbi:reverse transcriptase domain-containing protein [Nonomuraea sp. NPDC050786]|uniref:reverse transcriptase domain-containing protein n=1 Tax=Nonomuraea sp. NPDC050786 TaxID=3154840 RepID=UPI0033C97765